MTIAEYFNAIKERLVTDPIVAGFEIVRERATPQDGHLRARLVLVDGSQLEFSEYMQRSRARGGVEVITYSYHWADANRVLLIGPDPHPLVHHAWYLPTPQGGFAPA
jgi:hypothetical protein